MPTRANTFTQALTAYPGIWTLRRETTRHVFGPDADGSSLPGILVSHTLSDLRIVWRAANQTDNPFRAPDQLEKDVARIHDEGTGVMREFVDCERSVEHLLLATQLLETLRKG